MLLLELFNQPVKYTEREQHGMPAWDFTVGDNQYRALITVSHVEDASEFVEVFEIAFDNPKGPELKQKINDLFDDGGKTVINYEFAQVKDDQYLHGITGEGMNVPQVFGTVIEIFKKEVLPKVDNQTIVMMSAKEKSRIKLYDRLVKHLFGNKVERIDGFMDTYYVMRG